MYNYKTIIAIASGCCGIVGIPALIHYLEKRDANALEAKKAEIAAGYPPEYWEAEAAKAREKGETERAKIESDERLALDRRERETAEAEAKREFEKDAPDSYWEHKRVEEEERTRRELNKQRYEAELEAGRAHERILRMAQRG